MDSFAAVNTIFAFLVRNLELDYSVPKVVGLLAITAGAFLLMFWDIRRSKKTDPGRARSAQVASRDSRVA